MFEPPHGAFSAAERVPAWARPAPRAFAPAPAGAPPSFAAWTRAADFEPEPEPEPAAPIVKAETLVAQGFAEGLLEGRRQAEAEFAEERAALAMLAQSLEVLRPEPPATLAALLAATVRRLVAQVIGEVEINGALLEERVIALAGHVTQETGPSRLRMHPHDAARLADAVLPIAPTPDASLRPGTVVLETASGWVEDGPAVRLEQLHGLLDRMGVGR